jgi:predicted NBD/HSP70 family sugar kinase
MPLKEKILFTTHRLSERENKSLLFLDLIRKRKSISRTEITNITKTTAVTVSNYINGYLKKELVKESGYEASSGGRRPELIELNTGWGYVLGIDIAEKHITGVAADLGMEALANEPAHSYKKENLKSSISKVLEKLIDSPKIDKAKIKKIGIGISANSNGIMEEVVKLKETIEQEIKIPMQVGKGALCAAYGEKTLNPEAIEASSLLYVYTDLGEVIFTRGNEFYGSTAEKDDEYAYLRPWNKSLGVISGAKGIIKEGIGSEIVNIADGNAENVTLKTVIKAAGARDEVICDLLRSSGTNLGVRIAYLINSFEPEVVIIGGGIEKAGDFFLAPLASSTNRFILQRILNKVKLTPAVLGEEACVKGVASLAIREVFIEA